MKQDKNIDEFSKNLIKDVGLETPSSNFVSNVINNIQIEQNRNMQLVYKPLISKLGWFCIALIIIGLFVFFNISNTKSILQFPTIDLSFFRKINVLHVFEQIKLSKLFTFSFILFSVLVLFQLYYIKKYFNKNTII